MSLRRKICLFKQGKGAGTMKQYLETGKIVNTHGIRGEVKIQPWSDSPQFLLQLRRIYLEQTEYSVESARVHQQVVLMKLRGIDSIDAAMPLKNKVVFFNREDMDLPKGQYYIQDILGFSVFDARQNQKIGILESVEEYPAGSLYFVKHGTCTYLIPAVFVRGVDMDTQTVTVETIKGMAEDED